MDPKLEQDQMVHSNTEEVPKPDIPKPDSQQVVMPRPQPQPPNPSGSSSTGTADPKLEWQRLWELQMVNSDTDEVPKPDVPKPPKLHRLKSATRKHWANHSCARIIWAL